MRSPPSRNTSCCPSPIWTAALSIPRIPRQVVVSYFQGGKICDYITEKWGWDTILAMLHDYANGEDTPDVIRKELKMEPEEFDKQFLAYVEAAHQETVDHFAEWKDGMKKIDRARARRRTTTPSSKKASRFAICTRTMSKPAASTNFWPHAYVDKKDKPDAIDELERYAQVGGRSPATLKLLAKDLTEAGQQEGSGGYTGPVELYLSGGWRPCTSKLGELWLDQGNAAGAAREFRADAGVQAHRPGAGAFRSGARPEREPSAPSRPRTN